MRHRSDDEDRLLSDGPLDRLSAVPKGPGGTGTRRRLVPFQLPPKTINLDVGEAVSGLPLSELSRFEHQVLSVLRPFRKRLATAKMSSNREDGAVFRQEMDQSFGGPESKP
jgi:hypothetical protein